MLLNSGSRGFGLMRAWVGAEEVTTRCFAVDPVAGWADCFALNDRGRIAIGYGGEPITERLRGAVKVISPFNVA